MPRAAHQDRPRLSRVHVPRGPAAEPLTTVSPWARHDVGLYVAAAGTSVVGALLVWSATARVDGTAYLVRHLLTAAVGMGLALLVSRVGQQRVRLAAPWVYAGSLLLLLAVLTPSGRTVNGSRSWIPLVGGFTIQPAELAKVGLCLALATLLAGQAERGLRTGPPRGGPGRRARGAADGAHPAAAGPRLGGGGRRRRRGGRHRGRGAAAVGGRRRAARARRRGGRPHHARCSATTSATG